MNFTIIIFLFQWFNWQTLKSDNFTVIYKPGYKWEATQALNNLEYYRQGVIDLTGNKTQNLPVVIEDIGIISNGFANPLFNNIHIFTCPPKSNSSLEGIEDWYRSVSVHEYTHIAHLTKTNGVAKILSNLFGSIFQPNIYSPGWIIEGITVFSESQISPYEGRLNDGLFDEILGSKIYNRNFPSIIEATNSPRSFPNGSIYLNGGKFFNFLSTRYGRDRFRVFFKEYGSYFWSPISALFPFLGIDMAAEKVYGKSFPSLFREWECYENNQFADWQMEGKQVSNGGWYINSLISTQKYLYYVRTRPRELDAFYQKDIIQILEFDLATKRERCLVRLNSPVDALKIYDNNLYYTTLELKRGMENVSYNGFGMTSVLHKRNLSTNVDEVLFTDDIRGFCILPDGKILYTRDRRHKFGSEIWCYTNNQKEKVGDSKYLIGEMEVTSNGIATVARRNSENWSLYLYKDKTLMPIVKTPWIEENLSICNENIIFTANYNKICAIYLYNLSERQIYRLTENGYANFGQVVGDTLYFVGLSENGFDIYKKKLEYEEYHLQDWPKSPDRDSLVKFNIRNGGYRDVLRTLAPALHVPFIFPADSTLKEWYLGGLVIGADATDENIYAALIAYNPTPKTPFFNISWQSMFTRPMTATLFYRYSNSFNLELNYPLLQSSTPGLSNLSVSLGLSSFDRFKRKEATPSLSFGFRYPSRNFRGYFSFPLERDFWYSSLDRDAQVLKTIFRQELYKGEFRIVVSAYNDPENPDTGSISLRGYEPIKGGRGAFLSTEYSHQVLTIRRGLWNPNIYLEDLFITVFSDVGLIDKKELAYSLGVEIKLETKIGFGWINLSPQFGIALTREKKLKPFWSITAPIL